MSDFSKEHMKGMGLVEVSPDVWIPKSMAEKVAKIKAKEAKKYQGNPKELSIDGPPTYRVVNGTKYYLTANVFFASHHWKVRNNITTWAKGFLKERMLHLKPLKARSTLLVIFSLKREITPKMNLDTDNRGFFWGKMFQDVLEDLELVPNDNAYWIPKVHYEFDWERKEDNLTFKIL